jgi:4-carboxymuconolactone decarboxylase
VANRLSTIERDALPEDQRRFHDAVKAIRRRPISGPFITLLNSSPDLAARFAHLGHYFHARGQADESILSVRVRTFTALILSRALDSPYEWAAWVGWALEAGVPQETADAIREQRTPQTLSAEDALVLDFCTQLLSGDHRVSDNTFAAALAWLGPQGVVELACTLGYFAMIAYPLNTFDIEMSSEQTGMRKAFEPLRVPGHSGSSPDEAKRPPARARKAAAAPRVALITRHEDLRPAEQHFFDRIVMSRGRISRPYQVMLHTPDVAARIAHVGAFLLYDSDLPPAVKTLTWLVAAREYDCEYEIALAQAHARRAGVQSELIEAIVTGAALPQMPHEQALLTGFCYALLRGNHHVPDSTYGEVVATFGIPATSQIAASLGYFVMWAFVLNACGITAEDDQAEGLL